MSTYKAALSLNLDGLLKVGESWEVSTEPSFPSVLESGELLSTAIERDPTTWLGSEMALKYNRQNPLLVKLVDAGATLSVQVHPPEDDVQLGTDESGKTEAWVVMDVEPEAAIYLGFRDAVTRAMVERQLAAHCSIEPLLNRVAVQPGDVFIIRPGTVHALGAGVTVLEPQRVLPGRRAVTYRLWDWDRTFDERGEISPSGVARRLHVEESLRVADWRASDCARIGSATRSRGRQGTFTILDEPELFAQEYVGTVSVPLPKRHRMFAFLCLSGESQVSSDSGRLALRRGESCVIPAESGNATVALTNGWAMAVCVQT